MNPKESPEMENSSKRPVRIGAVSYLNSKPLIEGLAEQSPDAELILDVPSRLADDLSAGALDVALIPSVECFRNPGYQIVSDACVAARGAVLSVKLYSRIAIPDIRRLALDDGSRTSAALVRVILSEQYGVEPALEPLPLGSSIDETDADAVLLIGDRAIRPPLEKFAATWDLGEKWHEWTGLPFVFAVWVAAGDRDLESLQETLGRARDLGCERIADIARREAPRLGISESTAYDYLTKNLHFQLGPAERSGLELFRSLVEKLPEFETVETEFAAD